MSKRGVLLHPIALVVMLAMALTGCSGEADGPARQEGASPELAGSVTGSVWVADENGDSMTVIDASTNGVIATLDGIEEPHNVQVGAGGDTVYAVSGSENLLVAIDAATFAVKATAPNRACVCSSQTPRSRMGEDQFFFIIPSSFFIPSFDM